MGSGELEDRVLLVIENKCSPPFERVATPACDRYCLARELAEMGVLVTAGAGRRQSRQLDSLGGGSLVDYRVTDEAGDRLVPACEGEGALLVVEDRLVPALHCVTGGTATGVDKAVDLAAMRILVAVETASRAVTELDRTGSTRAAANGASWPAEDPRYFARRHLLVTAVTGHRQVPALEREGGLLVCCQRESRR
jgi:hypothetical protein